MGLLLQSFVNGNTQDFSVGWFSLKAVPLIVSRTATLRIFNDRQLMLGTDKVAQPCNSSARSAEIPKLPFAVERDGVPINMVE